MIVKSRMTSLLLICVVGSLVVSAEPGSQAEPTMPVEPVQVVESHPPVVEEPLPPITIADVNITGRIDGQELSLNLNFEAETKARNCRQLLIEGLAVLQSSNAVKAGYRLDYDGVTKGYYVVWPGTGQHRIDASFVVKPQEVGGDQAWRQASVQTPSGRVRMIQLVSDETDLEVDLPGAMRVQKQTKNGQLVITGILGPARPSVVRWKPRIKLADAKLVLSTQANTIVDVRAGRLYLDTVFDFQIAQGRIETLEFQLPASLSITSLDGDAIRSWSLEDVAEGARQLVVELSRPQEKGYRLRVRAEAGIGVLPASVDVPAIEPTAGIRASGYLVVGTDSALQLVVSNSAGLTQVDAAVFPRVQAVGTEPRPIPGGKAFFYTHAGSHYQLQLTVDDIVPSYDVIGRITATVKEDDLVVEAELELDVRDAPIRELEVTVPASMVVAAVDGNQVDDYHVSPPADDANTTSVRVIFAKPVLGRALIQLRLELGHGPLEQLQTISALQVTGAKTHRGYVVVAAEAGIDLDNPQVQNLREVHTASVPIRVALAQFAYRFRDPDWSVGLLGRTKPAGIRAEVFHLQSVSESLAYGSAVVNYVITGSPVDELRFTLGGGVENVEFVGSDVRRWTQQDGVWVVKLARKVIGDYNLAVTYTQAYGADAPIRLGALQCNDVQTQTGYVVVTSPLDLKLQLGPMTDGTQSGLLSIAMDELPADYRLLTSSPILAAYKYVTEPHTGLLSIDSYRRSDLLPVIVDIAAHHTNLAVHPDGRIESVTRVRYKVKNTTGQFLSLAIPSDANVWSVSLIETEGGREQRQRLAASRDTDSDRLLVPLSRKTNPNESSTIELEYGQLHEAEGWWRYQLPLAAPLCAVPVNYAEWTISAPREWVIENSGGNMQAQQQSRVKLGLARVLDQIGRLWSQSAEDWLEEPVVWVAAGIALVLIVLCGIFVRRRLPELVVVVLLAVLISAGIAAAASGRVKTPAAPTSLSYDQVVNADPSQALQVTAELVPAWRRDITGADIVAVSIIIVAAVVLAAWRRCLRWPSVAMLLVAGLYLAGRIPTTWPVLEMMLTWGGPTALAVWCLGCVLLSRRRRRGTPVVGTAALAPVVLVALLLSFAGGCVEKTPGPGPIAEGSTIESIDCRLKTGADNVELRYSLRISAKGQATFALLDESAVLVSDAQPKRNVKIAPRSGHHTIEVEKGGLYEVEATFLMPLPATGANHESRFELPLPMALTNAVSLTIPDANVIVEAPQAVRLTQHVRADETFVETMFTPGTAAVFTWRPKERQASQEDVHYYAQDAGLAYVSSGLLQIFHAVRLQIAQGQVDTLKLQIPKGQAATSVNGPQIGSWRFDPITQTLEVRLVQPVTGVYEAIVVTQSATASAPYDIRLEPLVIEGAVSQRSVMGLATDASVYLQLQEHPAVMNTGDYTREIAQLISRVQGLSPEQITQAFRFDSSDGAITAQVMAVKSELRSQENARFNAEDDRLVYNSQWMIEISKAGRFDVVLRIPDGFDIDTLVSEQVSHWDETVEDGRRNVRVHFKRKFVGTVQLNLAMSQPISQMPARLTLPRVSLEGVLKHTGRLVVGSEQGVRLSVVSRQGVSEMDPAELGYSGQGLLAFQLLQPDWQLDLQTELIQPRVVVQSLHRARVTDGLVKHEHYLRYQLFYAGTKTFDLVLPSDATGVTITGPGIARREQVSAGQWRVELADKVYDRPYLLRVTYETRYDQGAGEVPLAPVTCSNVDLQQGYTAVFATDRVELSTESIPASFLSAEARSIPKYFGAGDLSGAAMCYRSASPDDVLTIKATRHGAAEQIGADVRSTDIATVIAPNGQAIHRVALLLRVGTRRHLRAVLPDGGTIWSLSVDGQAAQPSVNKNSLGVDVLLIPLPQQTHDDVLVDMVYVTGSSAGEGIATLSGWAGAHRLSGPQFDLPLKQITWSVYVPDDFTYEDFGGTLSIDRSFVTQRRVAYYDIQSYERQVAEISQRNDQFAQQQQELAKELAQQGRQTDARRALSIGYNFSRGNMALNEDIRVDLDNLLKQQAKVGLVNARGRLRRETSGTAQSGDVVAMDGAEISFSPQQADRIENSLGQDDNKNLELITQRIISTQAAAEGSVAQLQVAMPFAGRVLRFTSPLQVKSDAEMSIEFRAGRDGLRQVDRSLWYGLSLFVLLLVLGIGIGCIRSRWDRFHVLLMHSDRIPPVNTAKNDSDKPDEPDDPSGQVSAEELI